MTAPKINPAAIDLLARVFNSHKKGLPEWLKNGREAYLRSKDTNKNDRQIAINHQTAGGEEYLECIDFVGISGDKIEEKYLEWANPDAAQTGLKKGEAEGGQGNGGKAYLRQMFDRGFFISICNGKLSVVSFIDAKKYVLDFVPDTAQGKDSSTSNPLLPGIRKYAAQWLANYDLPEAHNITIVRGVSPKKPIEPDQLLETLQQSPQARETLRSCTVRFFANLEYKRELGVVEPQLHPAFPAPVTVTIPETLTRHGVKIPTTRPPEYGVGTLELCVSARPLQGQALATWNRIDFHGTGVSVIGFKAAEELDLTAPQYARHLFGRCTLPLLVDPNDNYEMQGRVRLNDGMLSASLYGFIAEEADKLLSKLAQQLAASGDTKKRKNLEKLNERLAQWIESKLSSLRGLAESGDDVGKGQRNRKEREKKIHAPAVALRIHRDTLNICKGVSYPLRAVAYDAQEKPVPPGRVTWRSANSSVVAVHPERGVISAKAVGLTTIEAESDAGLKSQSLVQVHEAIDLSIKNPAPARVGSNRRLPLVAAVKTTAGKVLKDAIVSWRSSDEMVATVGPDGTLVGGAIGEAEVVAHVGELESEPLPVVVEKGAAGKPQGGGKGRPRILLSGQHSCPFDGTEVILAPTDPAVYQRPYKPDYPNNIFWINLQTPLAGALLSRGEASVQWRTYHFQRLVDVYAMIELRSKFADSEELDVDEVLDEIHVVVADLYTGAKDELFDLLYDEKLDLTTLQS